MKNIINNWLDKNGTKEINKEVEMEAERYNKLISDFENMEGIISSMFDEKDWIKFERFVERQDNWKFERSSGYAGYRNKVTGDWIYEKHYLEKFAEKENKQQGKELTTEEVMEGRSSAYNFLDFNFREKDLKTEKLYTEEDLLDLLMFIEVPKKKSHKKEIKSVLKEWILNKNK